MQNTKSKNFSAVLFVLLFLLVFSPLHLDAQKDFLDSEPLSLEEAFKIDYLAKSASETIIRWKIKSYYYLYKDKFSFSSEDYFIDEVKFPIAKIKDDPYFGKSEVYYDLVEISLIVRPKTKNKNTRIIIVKYQGCWEGGVCYPVEKTLIRL